MGIRDWFRKKPEEPEEVVHEPVDLPELDKEELLDETLSALESEDVQLTESEVVEATPEYDRDLLKLATYSMMKWNQIMN